MSLARRRFLLPLTLLTLLLAFGCSGPDRPTTLGNLLPADTLAWLHLEDVPELEDSLARYGLLELLVAELDKPEVREEVQARLGLTVADDPGETVHQLLQDLRRVDLSAHAPLHEGDEDPVLVVHAECADEAAAERIMDLLRAQAGGEVAVGDFTAMILDVEGDRPLLAGATGVHLVLASEAERWGETVAAILDPPATGLVDTEAYLKVAGDEPAQITVYATPEFQSELHGLGAATPGLDPASMYALMDKYGAQHVFLTADYLMSRLVLRQAMPDNSPLAPLIECASTASELVRWMPADAFFYESWLVEDGRRKLEIIGELITDAAGAAQEAGAGQVPPVPEDPFAEIEANLGFSLLDMAERLREVGVAGTGSAGWMLLMRAVDETQAQEVLAMIEGCGLLGMIPETTPITAGDVSLRSFTWPDDPDQHIHLLGRRGDTVVLAFMVPDAAAAEAFLGQIGDGALPRAVPAHAAQQLNTDGCGWGYVDLAALVTEVGGDLDDMPEDMPPAIAQRIRELKLAGRLVVIGDGVSELVMETGTP